VDVDGVESVLRPEVSLAVVGKICERGTFYAGNETVNELEYGW